MTMHIFETELEIPARAGHAGLLAQLGEAVQAEFSGELLPVRFVITATTPERYRCEVGVIAGLLESRLRHTCSIFEFERRRRQNSEHFNAVLLVPTGIGCTIGGHAGDANPTTRLLATVCDTLITHPNAVNASDINELPDNALYVEGSIISRLLMGTVGLERVRANRVLAVIDAHPDATIAAAAVNSVSAARASYGLDCPRVMQLDPPVKLSSQYARSGRAVGRVENLEGLLAVLDEYHRDHDALAISTQIEVPLSYHLEYFRSRGEMINPWGGVEAIFTHALSSLYDIPAAHSPMLESLEVLNLDPGVVDVRMAAEAISNAFFLCVLKGLQRSPRIVRDRRRDERPGVLTAADIACLVIPDGCIGLPTLAALEQGIQVIAVRENRNIMRNDLGALPWGPGQLQIVENYWEAAGVMAALKAGLRPDAVRRPLADTVTETRRWR
jgi:hypothetical protein